MVRGLQVPRCGGVPALGEGDDVIHRWAERVTVSQAPHDGALLAVADRAHRTRLADLLDQSTPGPAAPAPLRVPLRQRHRDLRTCERVSVL